MNNMNMGAMNIPANQPNTYTADMGIHFPPPENFNTEAMKGSFQQILSENIGNYAHIDFLIGTTELVRKSGYIFAVGRGVVTLYDDANNVYVTCDVYSVKFVTFIPPVTQMPVQNIPMQNIYDMQMRR